MPKRPTSRPPASLTGSFQFSGKTFPEADPEVSPAADWTRRQELARQAQQLLNPAPTTKLITKKQPKPRVNHKLEKIVLIREKEERGQPLDIGYLPEIFTRCHMPMSPPKNVLVYERRDGQKTLRYKADVDSKFGLMYGDDLITLAALMTKAREQLRDSDNQHPEELRFPSTAQMLDQVGMPPDGPHYKMMLRSIERIHDTTVEFVEITARIGKAERRDRSKASFIKRAVLWYGMNEQQIRIKGKAFENIITLSHELMEFLRSAKGIEFEKLIAIGRKNIGMMQLFCLLRDRCANKDLADKAELVPQNKWPEAAYTFIPVHGPNSLESQLGWLTKQQQKKVRWQLRKWLSQIRATIWKNCPGELVQDQHGTWRLKIWYHPPPRA